MGKIVGIRIKNGYGLWFIILINELIKNTGTETNQLQTIIRFYRLQPMKIEALMHADDIVLIAYSENKMQKLIYG